MIALVVLALLTMVGLLAKGAARAHHARWKQENVSAWTDGRYHVVNVPSDPPPLRPRPIGSRFSLEIAIEAPDNVAVACDILERVRP